MTELVSVPCYDHSVTLVFTLLVTSDWCGGGRGGPSEARVGRAVGDCAGHGEQELDLQISRIKTHAIFITELQIKCVKLALQQRAHKVSLSFPTTFLSPNGTSNQTVQSWHSVNYF